MISRRVIPDKILKLSELMDKLIAGHSVSCYFSILREDLNQADERVQFCAERFYLALYTGEPEKPYENPVCTSMSSIAGMIPDGLLSVYFYQNSMAESSPEWRRIYTG